MSEEQLIEALLTGKPYFGPAMRGIQSPPVRHGYFVGLVKAISEAKRQGTIQILEVGSWTGASAVTWAKAVQKLGRDAKITCVDQWLPYFDEALETAPHYQAMNAAATDNKVLNLFLHNIRAMNVSQMVNYQIGDTRKVLPDLPTAEFDIVYIDGSHVFEVVRADIREAKRLVRDGGIVCGDDLELQRFEVDDDEQGMAVGSKKDFVYSRKAEVYYHPGVTEAVALEFGEVSCWEGVWAMRKLGSQWAKVDIDAGAVEIPDHIKNAIPELEALEVGQTRDYFLVKIGETFIAVAKALGRTNLFVERLGERELSPILFTGNSLQEVRTKVVETEEKGKVSIELVGETAKFNLVKVNERFLAVAKCLGPTKLFAERLGERELAPLLFLAGNLEGVREKALQFERKTAVPGVELVDELQAYNVLRAGENFIAVTKDLGGVNLLRERLGERSLPPILFVAPSAEEVRRMIIQKSETYAVAPQVELVDEVQAYNVLRAGESFIAVRKDLGPVNLLRERLGERSLPPILFVTSSAEEVRRMIFQNSSAGVLDVYQGFNILWVGDRFFGVHQSVGPFDPSQVQDLAVKRKYQRKVVFGDSIEAVHKKIDALG